MKLRILPFLLLLVVPSLFAEGLDFGEAGRIVIQSEGRKKPLETFAAESLQLISGRRAITDPKDGRRFQAVDALCSMWFRTRDWSQVPVVLLPDADLRRELGLTSPDRKFSLAALKGCAPMEGFLNKIQGKHSRNEELTPIEKEAETVLVRMELLERILSGEALTVMPAPEGPRAEWRTLALAGATHGEAAGQRVNGIFQKVVKSYAAADAGAFRADCREFRKALAELAPAFQPPAAAIEREVFYNHLHPFRWAWLLYATAFFVTLAPRLRKIGLGIFSAGIVMHAWGFLLRCLIAGRAPVTNMYESVVWVSLGVAVFALIFELIFRARVYVLAAAPLAVIGLILADLLPSVLNPSIRPLPPVLRDNFWLATHVLTITLGYAAFALTMALGHIVLGHYLFRGKEIDERSPLHHWLYRILQVGVVLLAVGTILGGVWANYSWGRFWGWDPKETWALIALLLYIFSLHGRMVHWWGNFGLGVASVICFNGVLMAWYGVNFVLGKGMHSYGFGGGGGVWVGGWVVLDLVFVGLCVMAHRRQLREAGR